MLIAVLWTACREKDNLLLKEEKKATFKESWEQKGLILSSLCHVQYSLLGQLPFSCSCWFKFYLSLTLFYMPYYFAVGLSQLQGWGAEVTSGQTGLVSMCYSDFAKGNSLGTMRVQSVGGCGCCEVFFWWTRSKKFSGIKWCLLSAAAVKWDKDYELQLSFVGVFHMWF